MKTSFLLSLMAVALWLPACNDDSDPVNPSDTPYEVTVDPADFLPGDSITGNTYFPLVMGRAMMYLGKDGSDSIRVEETVTDSIKIIMGVSCRVVNAKEYENGQLIEDTDDWYAQDRFGNVWYFGEYSKEIDNGVVVSTAGSWESGVDGALPGIIMMANPLVGTWYRQEYYQGEAEDVAQVQSIGESLTVPYGTFNNCLRTKEWSVIESNSEENKIYAPGVGLLRAVSLRSASEFEDLVSVTVP